VAAPESANNVVTATALVPLLSLGIPGSNSAAVLLGGFLVHGLQPGPMLFEKAPQVVYGLYAGLLVANLAMLLIGLVILTPCIWLVNRPKPWLIAFILALVVSGVYSVHQSLFEVGLVLGIGALRLRAAAGRRAHAADGAGVVLGFMIESQLPAQPAAVRRRPFDLHHGPRVAGAAAGAAALAVYSTWQEIRRPRRRGARRWRSRPREREPFPKFRGANGWRKGIAALPEGTPPAMRQACGSLLVDVAGICIAARRTDFMRATVQASDDPGRVHRDRAGAARSVAMAALCNGTAAHGEDYDDTFEGGPAHAGAVIVPAVLATAERHGLGAPTWRGIAVGCEVMCRCAWSRRSACTGGLPSDRGVRRARAPRPAWHGAAAATRRSG
jgi:hypothetical protein